jgi:hypothetical protein
MDINAVFGLLYVATFSSQIKAIAVVTGQYDTLPKEDSDVSENESMEFTCLHRRRAQRGRLTTFP